MLAQDKDMMVFLFDSVVRPEYFVIIALTSSSFQRTWTFA
jgi:hypothetical protein